MGIPGVRVANALGSRVTHIVREGLRLLILGEDTTRPLRQLRFPELPGLSTSSSAMLLQPRPQKTRQGPYAGRPEATP